MFLKLTRKLLGCNLPLQRESSNKKPKNNDSQGDNDQPYNGM